MRNHEVGHRCRVISCGNTVRSKIKRLTLMLVDRYMTSQGQRATLLQAREARLCFDQRSLKIDRIRKVGEMFDGCQGCLELRFNLYRYST